MVLFEVIKAVLKPIFDAALLASHPACPPPTTIISYFIFTQVKL